MSSEPNLEKCLLESLDKNKSSRTDRGRPGHPTTNPEYPEKLDANKKMLRCMKVIIDDLGAGVMNKFQSKWVKKEVMDDLRLLEEQAIWRNGTFCHLKSNEEQTGQLTNMQNNMAKL